MSRKNRRRNMNRPLPRTITNSPSPTNTAAATPLDSIARHQETPYFEQNPKGGLRITLTEDCWCELANIPSHKLLSDPAYQRDIRENHVQEILSEWDARVMNFPKVSQREDGNYYIFDGAHTKTVTDRLNGEREHMVPCILYHNLKLEDEAYLFAMQKGCSREVAFGYKLNSLILSGDTKATGFQACNDRLGLKIMKESRGAKNVISAVNTAYRLYDNWGAQRYLEAMSLIVDTWGCGSDSLSQVVIEGISRFLRAYSDVYDRNRFIRDVSAVNVKRLAEKGRASMRDTAQEMANLLVQLYNRKGGKYCVKPDWLMVLTSMKKNEEFTVPTAAN